MSIGNPYKCRNRLPADSDMFFGRKREMARMMDMLSSKQPQNISLVGERRIGKSSLAFQVFHKIKEKGDTLAIYLDCDSLPKECNCDNDFYKLVNDSLMEELDRDTGMKERVGISEKVLFTGYREFRRFVGGVSQKGLRVVFFFDEFEHLPDKGFADNSFFSNLRSIADTPDFSLAFVTISKTEIKELTHKAIQSSSFYNIFETMTIGLLDHKSIVQLRKKGFQAEKFKLLGEEMKRINYYSGDFAFFNQLVCAFLWDAKHYEETPEWDDLEVKLLPYYDTLWQGRSRNEQVLLKKLKKDNKSSDFELKALKVRGLLTRVGNLYYPFSDFFGRLMDERFEIRKKDISQKEIFKTAKEVLDVLSSAKDLIPGKGD
jgi:AAA+ ATPase superfamily predicted ATPase